MASRAALASPTELEEKWSDSQINFEHLFFFFLKTNEYCTGYENILQNRELSPH